MISRNLIGSGRSFLKKVVLHTGAAGSSVTWPRKESFSVKNSDETLRRPYSGWVSSSEPSIVEAAQGRVYQLLAHGV